MPTSSRRGARRAAAAPRRRASRGGPRASARRRAGAARARNRPRRRRSARARPRRTGARRGHGPSARIRRLRRAGAHEARAPVARNTLPSTVTVRYPFHPLAGRELEVLNWHPRCRGHGGSTAQSHPEGCVTVRGPDGFDLKVPQWMLSPSAAVEISSEIIIDIAALQALLALVAEGKRLLTAGQEKTVDPRRTRKEGDRRAPARTRSPGRSSAVKGALAKARRQDASRSRSPHGRSHPGRARQPHGGRR